MPNPGAFEVGQRRFWNALGDQPGVIYVGSWGWDPGLSLYAGGGLVYTAAELALGPLPFPTELKLTREWKLVLSKTVPSLIEAGCAGTNEWIFFPYSNDLTLFKSTDPFPDANGYWHRGDHPSDNLFWDALVGPAPASGPWSCVTSPTRLHYAATCEINEYTYGFGNGGDLYGYLNNVYFGENGYGGNKPNVGIPGKLNAVGDLSKRYEGFWGALGTDAGLANPGPYTVYAEWVFDLCDRPEAAATAASLSLGNQSEGWGVDTAPLSTDSMGHRIFTLSTSPARGTLNVYTPKGLMLMKGLDWDNDPCDTTGLVYRLLHDISGQCETLSRVVVTYLVMAAALRQAKRTARTVDTNVGSNRLNSLDIRGL